MSLTRGQLIANVATMLERPDDSAFISFLESRLDQMIFAMFDMHDWNFKHKVTTFNTVAATESYTLDTTQRIYHGAVVGGPYEVGEVIEGTTSTATGVVIYIGVGYLSFTTLTGAFESGEVITGLTSGATSTSTTSPSGGVAGAADLRSSEDIEVMWDSTNKRFLHKVDLKTIRKQYPSGSESGTPTRYAPWGTKTIFLDNIPDGIYSMNFLYIAKPTLPTSDTDDLEVVCGIPDYCHYLLEKLVLAEGMIIDNDTRRDNLLMEIDRLWKRNAINADMKHLESTARFKFWEEEIQPYGHTYDDFLRATWWDE